MATRSMGIGHGWSKARLACTRGATALTYIMVLGLVSLVGAVAFAEFGDSIRNGVRAETSAAAKSNGDEVDGPVGSLAAEVATAGAEQLVVQGSWALSGKAGLLGLAAARRTRRGRSAQRFDDKRQAGGEGTRDRDPNPTRNPDSNPSREPPPSNTPKDVHGPSKDGSDGIACTSAGCRAANGQCFVAGTLISTPNGLVPIETIAPGDAVFSRNEQTGETSVSSVVQTFVRGEAPLVRVSVADDRGQKEDIFSTHGHPFFSVDRGWVRADELAPDELLLDAAGGPVWALAVDMVNEPATVYNFEVADTHSYFVGALQVWVHNLGGSLILGITIDELKAALEELRRAPSTSAQAAARARDIQILEDQIAVREIMEQSRAADQGPGSRIQPARGAKKKWEPPSVSDDDLRSGRPRRQPGHVYPNQGQLPGYKRGGMGDKITDQTIARDEGNSSRTEAGSRMAFDQNERDKPRGLRELEISRNHIIADSSIARLLTEARNNANTEAARADVDRFIDAAIGPGTPAAADARTAFRDSQKHRKTNPKLAQAELDRVIRATSTGINNLRFDDATLNGHILHGADYELQNGRMSDAAAQLREATLGLAHHGAVSPRTAFDAAQPTIKVVTNQNGVRRGEYLSSTTSSRPSGPTRWGDPQDPDTLRPRPSNAPRRAASEPPPPRDSRASSDSSSSTDTDSDRMDIDSDHDRMDIDSDDEPPRKRTRQCD